MKRIFDDDQSSLQVVLENYGVTMYVAQPIESDLQIIVSALGKTRRQGKTGHSSNPCLADAQ